MALNKVEICGVNTSRLPILSEEEKTELFRRIKQGIFLQDYFRGQSRGICVWS